MERTSVNNTFAQDDQILYIVGGNFKLSLIIVDTLGFELDDSRENQCQISRKEMSN